MQDYNKKIEQMDNLLRAKEDRFNYQRELVDKYNNTLISFMLNIAGEVKISPKIRNFHKIYIEKLLKILSNKDIKVLFSDYRYKNTGDEFFMVVDFDANSIKKLTIELEESNHKARLLDIDVFDKDMNQISRETLGLSARKCLICERDAKYCMRAKAHTIEELIDVTNRLMEE